MASRAAYTAAAREAEALGWTWTYRQFDPNLAVFDMKTDRWVKPIHDALIPKKGTPAGVHAPVGIAR